MMKIIGRNLLKKVNLGEFESIEIVNDDGRIILEISQQSNNKTSFRVDAGEWCLIDGVMYDNKFSITPTASNCITLTKEKCKS